MEMFKEWIGYKNGTIKPQSKKIKKRAPPKMLMVSIDLESEIDSQIMFDHNQDESEGKH